MRGEYKTPGGKLVAVEFDVVDGRLAGVRVSGDFFLYADDDLPLNDIASAEGKIGGAAQARKPGVVLHHTTIAYEMNPDEMLRVLRIGREKLSDKGIASANKRVSPLRRQTDRSREAIVELL